METRQNISDIDIYTENSWLGQLNTDGTDLCTRID